MFMQIVPVTDLSQDPRSKPDHIMIMIMSDVNVFTICIACCLVYVLINIVKLSFLHSVQSFLGSQDMQQHAPCHRDDWDGRDHEPWHQVPSAKLLPPCEHHI